MSLYVSGKQLWSVLAWRIWVLHMSSMQQRENTIMYWLVLITTATWTSSTMAWRLMTNPASTSPSTSALQPSSSTRPSVTHTVSPEGKPKSVSERKFHFWMFLMKASIVTSFCSRPGAGSLCDGPEQVSHSGLGISDDETRLICCGCYWACATAPLHPAQSWLPETTPSPGHHVTGREAEAKKRDARPTAHSK